MRLSGKVIVILSAGDDKAVDVVNVTVKDAEPDATAVVMLRAVAAADTHPTHGVFTRADSMSLFVLISTPAPPDAKDAACAYVVRPLQVTVTAPAGTEPVCKVIVIALLENADAHTVEGDITPHV